MIERFKNRKLDQQETKVLGHIESHGWSVTNIGEEHGRPGWSFTIGLFENYGHPEVILFGLRDNESRHRILNWIGENARDGRSFAAGKEHDWVLDGHNCFSREVHQHWYGDLVGWAIWFYGGAADFPLVQCFWPSREGQYPWQSDEYSPQPLLYEAEFGPARMLPYAHGTDWPFAEDPHLGVYVSRCVMEDGAPVDLVVHDSDGDWQFIGPVEDPEADGIKLVCLRHLIDRYPALRVHAGLQVGWQASRSFRGARWKIQEIAS